MLSLRSYSQHVLAAKSVQADGVRTGVTGEGETRDAYREGGRKTERGKGVNERGGEGRRGKRVKGGGWEDGKGEASVWVDTLQSQDV